jgi:DNA-binding FrmR family transcriptional regulator
MVTRSIATTAQCQPTRTNMNESESAIPTAPAVVDSFAAVAAMLALVVDPKACSERLHQLRALRQAAEEAQDTMVRERATHDAAVAKARAEIAERQAALNKREIALRGRESAFEVYSRVGGRAASRI